jgi:hypothetical protein
MGGACGTYGGGERCIPDFGRENPREGDHLGDPGVDGRIILMMDIREVGCGGMNWIELAQDRDRWRAVVNAVMSPRVP